MAGSTGADRRNLPFIVAVSILLITGLLAFVWFRGGEPDRPSFDTGSSLGLPSADARETTTTTVGTTTTTAPPGPEELTLVFAGDLLPHMAVNDQAAVYAAESGREFDYRPMFEPLRPILEGADLAICHMEVPTVPEGEPITSYPSFGAPPELATDAGAAGYDGCSTASNHSLDRGRAGLDRLLDTFDAAEMGHTGTARTEDEGDGRAHVYDVEGVKIAHLSYAYDFNGYRIPEEAPWSVNQIDPPKIIRRAEEARAEGADLVVLSLHWGTEYQHDPDGWQERWADEILESPEIDVIIGHHAHVVQPIERVKDRFVVWGLGNQVSNQEQLPRRDGLTVRLHAAHDETGNWSIREIDAIPTYVELGSFRILPVVDTLRAGDESEAMQNELRASHARTTEVLEGRPTEGVNLDALP